MKQAILLFQAPDQQGIVHKITKFVLERKGNITELEQFVDNTNKKFFMRIVWQVENQNACATNIDTDFKPIASELSATFNTYCSDQIDRMALFCSATQHCMAEVLLEHAQGDLQLEIPLIISNSKKCEPLAKKFEIPFYFISTKTPQKEFEQQQLNLCKQNKIDFIALARYMKILSPEFVQQYPNKIINIHHSFLPSFIGNTPYQDAYNRGVKLIGATSHFVIPQLDEGPIIEQDVKRISHAFDTEELIAAGKEVEKRVFLYALKKYTQRKLMIDEGKVVVFE
jgi:formyltetrahydrofolate deformylase